jgi:hypothetical protein
MTGEVLDLHVARHSLADDERLTVEPEDGEELRDHLVLLLDVDHRHLQPRSDGDLVVLAVWGPVVGAMVGPVVVLGVEGVVGVGERVVGVLGIGVMLLVVTQGL